MLLASHDSQIAARCDRLIRLRAAAAAGDINMTDGYPIDDVIRRVGHLG